MVLRGSIKGGTVIQLGNGAWSRILLSADWSQLDGSVAPSGVNRMVEAVGRFLIGGLFIPAFPILRYGRRPKSFAGLFGTLPPFSPATLSYDSSQFGRCFRGDGDVSPFSGAVAVSFTHAP